ncbi:hypothetical protein [Streptomyces noursei]|uniref:hypothetical protein n=1 Tax=Streptomyces noursei TaxID=1971 RepID=UPI0016747CFE|nr:hypothetical protein [Streptomyces noursei]MCZ1019417.1 hypothetical protein [Streptomyces noursei]GGX08260.1 hypothetical protein GCM10010341_32420 [Streptomyces noursei]
MEKLLPDFNTLVRLSQRGLSDDEIGKRYGTTGQAVNKALVLGDYRRTTTVKLVNELIPWDVKTTKGVAQAGETSHHNTYPCKLLRAYMRTRLSDETITEANKTDAARFEARLRRQNVVLDYDREKGFSFVPRTPEDKNFVLRWPAGEPLPANDDQLRAVTLDD